ncbi:hypothetical protein SAMN05444678_102234 [Sphingomonas sp. YR710]|uniref:hypothetical protein n=1 Tax=Sphingomonas sp. YR710 TaxID=1882773 RepID=UPI000880C49D|nr:hypothetical protein [Sphingomonas sp. YR710]SDC29895.1 hypothetical protein SAMN05444678_102234 [Sphingomonas sp. YR710]
MRRESLRIGLTVALICATPSLAAPKKLPAKPMPFAQAFLKQQTLLSPINNCQSFVEHVASLVPSNGLLHRLLGDATSSKSEFESSAAYSARLAQAKRAAVGDLDKIYIRTPVPNDAISYDADHNLLTIDLTGVKAIPIGYWNVKKQKIPASNAYGVKRIITVTTGQEIEAAIFWLPGEPPQFEVPLSPTDALLLKAGFGELHILGRLGDLTDEDDDSSPATVTDPTEYHFRQLRAVIHTRCVAITFGHTVFPKSKLDQWDDQ